MSDKLVCNKIRTPDGTILESTSVHDYRTHIDKVTGEEYMVDGGLSYARRNVNKEPYEELSVYTSDPHELIRDNFTWGTYGKDGKQPFKRVKLREMTTAHINAILETQFHIPYHIEWIFKQELSYRDQNMCHIEEKEDD